jgi:hypothetical protein
METNLSSAARSPKGAKTIGFIINFQGSLLRTTEVYASLLRKWSPNATRWVL